jgi:hypothetical protein|tara:strand:- start:4521 stop:7337 length:2817 start_codon:yes stop_codon:yes gene_type:complete
MSATNYNNQNYAYFGNSGSANSAGNFDSLPNQTLPRSKKNLKWEKATMDALENIGLKQIQENKAFADYRKMAQGRLSYVDFDETQTDLRGIQGARAEQKLPTFLKHYDLIGRIINLLAGEFNNQKETINITTSDVFSKGEFLREKDKRIVEFTENYFNTIIEIGLIEKGLDPNKKDFKSEEEKQQYLQTLQQQADSIIPPHEIEKDLKKNFKTAIVEWAEKTLEQNYVRFSLDALDLEELKDYLISGRYFRNYYVGFDSYSPETWDIERTFFSQDLNVVYPKDCEYAGTIHLLSPASLIKRYGHMLPKTIQDKLYGDYETSDDVDSLDPMAYLQRGGAENTLVPHAGYYGRKTSEFIQDLTGTPQGIRHGTNGEDPYTEIAWLSSNQSNSYISGFGRQFRDDINVRLDEIQVTEAYFISQKLVGLVTLQNELTETPLQEFVEEDLLSDVIEHYELKEQKNKSWQEVVENPMDNINTITWGYLGEAWKGHKINSTGTNLKKDHYFGIAPLDYQIKGKNNDFDVVLPLGGIISSGIGEMIRSYQTDYNIVLNQNRQYLEKTIGSFFMMDWHLLPSQFKNEQGETTAELIEEWRETIRELGIGLTDQSPRNTEGNNPNQNNIQQYNVSYIADIQNNMQIARDLEQKAFAIIGITPERMGSTQEYMTAEGVKQGAQASYAQTEIIYKRFNSAKIQEKEIELAIAQYAATNGKDMTIDYINGQNERIIQNFTDIKDFSFRKLGVHASDDSTKRKELEMFKNTILQMNTMDNSIYDLGKVVTSDNFVSLLDYGLEKEQKKNRELKETRAHEEKIAKVNSDTLKEIESAKLQNFNMNEEKDRRSEEYIAETKARSATADSNADTGVVDMLFKEQDIKRQEQDSQNKSDQKQQEIGIKRDSQKIQAMKNMTGLALEFDKLKQRREEMQSKERISEDQKDIARINPS